MPGGKRPEKYLRWRVDAGGRDDRRRRRWPIAMLGSGLTVVPVDSADPAGRGAGLSGRRPVGPWSEVFVGRMTVAVRSVSWLRHLLDQPVALARVRRVRVVVDDWRIPQRGWSGRLGPLPHLLDERTALPRADRGRAVVELELRWSVPLRSVLVAVLPLFAPQRPLPSPARPEVTAQDVLPGWLGAGPNLTVVAGDLPGRQDVRPYDIVLRRDDVPRPDDVLRTHDAAPVVPADGQPTMPADGSTADGGTAYQVVLPVDRLGAGPVAATGAGRGLVLVDLEHVVPAGRYGPFGSGAPRAELLFPAEPDGRSWRITGPGGSDLRGRLERPWSTEQVHAALAGIGVLHCRSVPGRQPRAEAALLLHLALAGVLVHAPGLPAACRAHLADELAGLLDAPLPDRPRAGSDPDTELAWEIRAVRQRRAAMRRHAREFVLPGLTAGSFPGLAGLPSVTALLVTRRLEYVLDAVAAIEAQTYPELEVVLCLHGVGLPADLRARLARCTRPLEIVEVPAGQSFGEAIGAATARARGSLVTKFDDDDTYGPEHVWDLVLARHHSGATLVGKAAEFVYLATLDTTVRRDAGATESFAPVVAGGTMLIGRGDLEQVGGWRPVPRSVDRGLIDRVRRAGGLVYRAHPLGYVYQRRSAGHTWDPGLEYFLRGGGAQWSGLPRHAEFGTAGPDVGFSAAGCDVGFSAAGCDDLRGAAVPGLVVPGPVWSRPDRPTRVGLPTFGGAADGVGLREDGNRIAGHCRRS